MTTPSSAAGPSRRARCATGRKPYAPGPRYIVLILLLGLAIAGGAVQDFLGIGHRVVKELPAALAGFRHVCLLYTSDAADE